MGAPPAPLIQKYRVALPSGKDAANQDSLVTKTVQHPFQILFPSNHAIPHHTIQEHNKNDCIRKAQSMLPQCVPQCVSLIGVVRVKMAGEAKILDATRRERT